MSTTFPENLPSPAADSLVYLQHINAGLEDRFKSLNRIVLDDAQFARWPGSSSGHHCHVGGLVLHTAEVMQSARSMYMDSLNFGKKHLNWNFLATGVIWHDYGKLQDYEPNPHFGPGEDDPKLRRDLPFRGTAHRDLIRHLPRSYAEFIKCANGKIYDNEIDPIAHMILAHHGRREWGAAVEPATPEAWALHLADMVSVRVITPDGREGKH